MIVLILFIQIVSLVFLIKFILAGMDYYTGTESNNLEKWFWYFIIGINVLFIFRFIYVQSIYSYTWFDQIMEIASLVISQLIVIPSSIFYIIKRNKKRKK